MTISGFFKRCIVFIRDFIKIKKEELALKKEIFAVVSAEGVSEDFPNQILEKVVSINKRKADLRKSFKENLEELRDDTVYGIKRAIGEEPEFEETPSFRDEPSPIRKVNKDESLEIVGLDPDFRKELGASFADEDNSAHKPEGTEVERASGLHTQSSPAENVSDFVEPADINKEPASGGVIGENSVESPPVVEGESGDNLTTKEPDVSKDEVVQEGGDIEVPDEGVEGVEEVPAERVLDKSEEDTEDPKEEAKKIIERINDEGIKLSTSIGKELKGRLEELGFAKDIHWRKDPETKKWILR